MSDHDLSVCHECGGGNLRRVAQAGRTFRVKGAAYEVPATLALLTCPDCGAEWHAPEDTAALQAAYEAQRDTRLVPRTGTGG
jgi:hypothetical protein